MNRAALLIRDDFERLRAVATLSHFDLRKKTQRAAQRVAIALLQDRQSGLDAIAYFRCLHQQLSRLKRLATRLARAHKRCVFRCDVEARLIRRYAQRAFNVRTGFDIQTVITRGQAPQFRGATFAADRELGSNGVLFNLPSHDVQKRTHRRNQPRPRISRSVFAKNEATLNEQNGDGDAQRERAGHDGRPRNGVDEQMKHITQTPPEV